MKTTALTLLALTAAAFAQGPLTPPGAPSATGKSLTEIYDRTEKRTPISSLPFAISQPGSYYLAQNLTATAAADGITITASNVTLDLNGFTLNGANIGTQGIYSNGTQATVKNGNIVNWVSFGVRLENGGGEGRHRVSGLSVSGTTCIFVGKDSIVSGCTIKNAIGVVPLDANGIVAETGGEVSDCVIESTGSGGPIGLARAVLATSVSRVSCRGSNGASAGILAQTVRDCSVEGYDQGIYATGSTASITGCRVTAASGGILAYAVASVENCVITSTGAGSSTEGIRVGASSSVENCTVVGFSTGIIGTTDCTASNSRVTGGGSRGAELGDGGTVESCRISGRTTAVRASGMARIRGNSLKGTGTGFAVELTSTEGASVESNVVAGYDICVFADTDHMVVARNTFTPASPAPLFVVVGPGAWTFQGIAPLQPAASATNPAANLIH